MPDWFLGDLRNVRGDPIEIDGLWALSFGSDGLANGKINQLFFTAGPSFLPNTAEYADGLYGVINSIGDDQRQYSPSPLKEIRMPLSVAVFPPNETPEQYARLTGKL